MPETKRYSDEDLNFFKNIIEEKLQKTKTELSFLQSQIDNASESMKGETDWMDDTSTNTELEMLYTMVNRNQRYSRDLENALLRIRSRSYGICVVTGELIDKRRLIAVPTTTKSVVAKILSTSVQKNEKIIRPKRAKAKSGVITKVIRKSSGSARSGSFEVDDDEEGFLVDDLIKDFDELSIDSEEFSD